MSKKKIYVLDTNVLLHDPSSILSFQDNRVVIPMMVLEELDNLKDRKDKSSVSYEARQAIKNINALMEDASPEEIEAGVKIKKTGGIISVFPDHLADSDHTGKKELRESRSDEKHNNDNIIINVAIKLTETNSDTKVCLVTKDINMRLKAKSAGVLYVEDYKTDQLVDDVKLLDKGYEVINGFTKEIQQSEFESKSDRGDVFLKIDRPKNLDVFFNKYIVDEENNSVVRIMDIEKDHLHVKISRLKSYMNKSVWGLEARNTSQALALDLLMDDDIDIAILVGPAGTGKTLLTLAAGLQKVMEENKFEKIIVSRSTPPVAEDIGFLPGTEEEKMMPWLGAFVDNLEFLHKHEDKGNKQGKEFTDSAIEMISQQAGMQFKSLNFMRGRSFNDTLLIIDEVQSLTPFQLKTIITRVGSGSKIVCMGNLAQIDSNYITDLTSGLTHIAERFKYFKKAGIIHLDGVERSELAKFAEENL